MERFKLEYLLEGWRKREVSLQPLSPSTTAYGERRGPPPAVRLLADARPRISDGAVTGAPWNVLGRRPLFFGDAGRRSHHLSMVMVGRLDPRGLGP